MKNIQKLQILILLTGLISLGFYGCKEDETLLKKDPVINWKNPADIGFGTLLSTTQLNALADVPGTFVYTPPAGTRLNSGTNQELKTTFFPADSVTYSKIS